MIIVGPFWNGEWYGLQTFGRATLLGHLNGNTSARSFSVWNYITQVYFVLSTLLIFISRDYCLEIFCKMSVVERNMDMLLSTGPWPRLEELIRLLCKLVIEKPPTGFYQLLMQIITNEIKRICHHNLECNLCLVRTILLFGSCLYTFDWVSHNVSWGSWYKYAPGNSYLPRY